MPLVKWEMHEHFEKMTCHNRYYLAGGNGLLQLSIPIQGGREHKSVISETGIANTGQWQQQQWRTIVSAYNNSAYFEYYAHSLEELFVREYIRLADFNLAGIHWLKRQLGFSFEEEETAQYIKQYPADIVDLRAKKQGSEQRDITFPAYYQVFRERNGFLPDLSVLDLLFAEGRYAATWIREHKQAVIAWDEAKVR